MIDRTAIRAALRASSRATVRPTAKPYPSEIEQRYRMQARQVEEMLGLRPCKKEGPMSQAIGCIGGLLGFGVGVIMLFHVLAHV